MRVFDFELPGLKVVELKLWKDERGFFTERFHAQRFVEHGLPTQFVQDNHSRSMPRVLRGMHYQFNPPQGKLVGCIRGRIWDAVVDVRHESPTFGRWAGIELNDSDGRMLWIPPGFAHGFCVLGDEEADVIYKVHSTYNAQGEAGLAWNDPDIGIQWPIENPILSGKDQMAGSFADYRKSPKY